MRPICFALNNISMRLRFQPQYVIVLTATPERDDQMDKILVAIAGDKRHQFWAISKRPFKVFPIETGYGTKQCKMSQTTDNLPTVPPDSTRVSLESAISKIEERNEKVVKFVRKIAEKTNFKILLCGDRVEQLTYFFERLKDYGVDVSRLFGAKDKKAEDAKVLVCGIKKAGAGWDQSSGVINWDGVRVDLLIMVISTYKIVQILGRVQRALDPYVVQLIDDHRWFQATFEDNCKEYEEKRSYCSDKFLGRSSEQAD